MRWYHWILLVCVLAPAAALAFLLGRRGGSLRRVLETEQDAIDARAAAARWRAEYDAQTAADMVENRYKDKILRMDEEATRDIQMLRNDPVALADLLARLSN